MKLSKAISITIRFTETQRLFMVTETPTRVDGRRTKNMEEEGTNSRRERKFMKVSGLTITSRENLLRQETKMDLF